MNAGHNHARVRASIAAPRSPGALAVSSLVTLQVPYEALQVGDLERIARAAQLPEIEAIDFRREHSQEPTWPELCDWQRIEHFAQLVLAAAAAREAHPPTSSTGAGPDAAA